VTPEPPAPTLTLEEEQVVANCYIVQQAVEAFAADNNGVYPHDEYGDRNLSGNNVLELLPGGGPLENPYDGSYSEPRLGIAAFPGQTGYNKTSDANGVPVDYVVSGYGESEVILYLTKDGPLP